MDLARRRGASLVSPAISEEGSSSLISVSTGGGMTEVPSDSHSLDARDEYRTLPNAPSARRRRRLSGSQCVGVHFTFGDPGQQHIELAFLVETPVQHLLLVAQIQLTGKRCGGAVSGNFVMLKLLGGGYQAGIAEVVSAEYAKHFPRFMDEGLHGLVDVCHWVGAMLSQHCCQSLPLGLSFPTVMEQQVLQCRVRGRCRHAQQRI